MFTVIWGAITSWGGIGFILLVILSMVVSWLVLGALLLTIGQQRVFTIAVVSGFLLSIFIMLEYWCLTGFLMWEIVFFNLVGAAVGAAVIAIYSAVIGIGSQDANNKFAVLSAYVFASSSSTLTLVTIGVAGLINIYLGYMALDHFVLTEDVPTKNAMILLYLYIVPQILGLIVSGVPWLSAMVNETADNDVRNRLVGAGISLALQTAILVSWPIVLYPERFGTLANLVPASLVNLGVGSIVIGAAILLAVAFFIGARNFQAQKSHFREFHKRVLAQTKQIAGLNEAQHKQFKQSRTYELAAIVQNEISNSAAFHGFYQVFLYHRIVTGHINKTAKEVLLAELLSSSAAMVDWSQNIPNQEAVLFDAYHRLIERYDPKLELWDIRAEYIADLLEVYKCLRFMDVPMAEVVKMHEERLLDVEKRTQGAWTGLVALGGWSAIANWLPYVLDIALPIISRVVRMSSA